MSKKTRTIRLDNPIEPHTNCRAGYQIEARHAT